MNKLEQLAKQLNCQVATYSYQDTPIGRIHHWMPSGRWALGNGPIQYFTKEEIIQKLKDYKEKTRS